MKTQKWVWEKLDIEKKRLGEQKKWSREIINWLKKEKEKKRKKRVLREKDAKEVKVTSKRGSKEKEKSEKEIGVKINKKR